MDDAVRIMKVEKLQAKVYVDRAALGRAAGEAAAAKLKELLAKKPVSIIFAAAPSQNEFLETLVAAKGIDWSRVTAFHMDEYVGLPGSAPQSFGRWLRDRIFDKVKPGKVHYLDGMAKDSEKECARYTALLKAAPPDITCMGIGENGHLAFNDPPVADFLDPVLIKVVRLDAACRNQQVNDGCFERLTDVPTHAYTLTIPALLRAQIVSVIVPGPRKANAVLTTLQGPISEACPASALRRHPGARLYLDADSARLVL